MMLARHMYGIQQLAWREVVWDGGILCEEAAAGGWRSAACGTSFADRLQWLQSLAELPLDEGISLRGETLSDEERASLEALGYVQ